MIAVTFEATNFICCPNSFPSDFSPPIDSTGMVSLVRDNSAKSLAVCGHDTKYCQAALIRPGREYASIYAFRSASRSERVECNFQPFNIRILEATPADSLASLCARTGNGAMSRMNKKILQRT